MKLSKTQMIVGFVLILLIIILLSLMFSTKQKIDDSRIVQLSELNQENKISVQSILEKHNTELLSIESIRYYVRFDRHLYNEDGTSNEQFFKNLINEILDFKQETFYLIDEEKNIDIKVFYSQDENHSIIINNNKDFYKDSDGEIFSGIENVDIIKYTNIYTVEESIDRISLSGLSYSEFVKQYGEPIEITEDGYSVFDEGNIKVITYADSNKIRNVVYSAKYLNKFVSDITSGYSLHKVVEEYGEPALGSIEDEYIGYRNDHFYIFFYDTEISVHGYDYNDQLKFERAVDTYLFDENLYRFYRTVKQIWPGFYTECVYDEEQQNLYMVYPSKGVMINIVNNDVNGIEFYSNYKFSDEMKQLIKNGRFTLKSEDDLVHILEKRRVNN